MKYAVEYTDTFAGEANYCWVRRYTLDISKMTHYSYNGSTNYCKTNKEFNHELIRKAKALVGLTGVRGTVNCYGDTIEFKPRNMCTVLFIYYDND